MTTRNIVLAALTVLVLVFVVGFVAFGVGTESLD